MGSTLVTTTDVEAIVESELPLNVLDIFIEEADAEIVGDFGEHPTDPENPTTARALASRRAVLIDLVRLSVAYNGAQGEGVGDGLYRQSIQNHLMQRQNALIRLRGTVRNPWAAKAEGDAYFGVIPSDGNASSIEIATNVLNSGEIVAGTWSISRVPTTGIHRLYWAVPSTMRQPRIFLLNGIDITDHVSEAGNISVGSYYYDYGYSSEYGYRNRGRYYRTYLTDPDEVPITSDNNGQDAIVRW